MASTGEVASFGVDIHEAYWYVPRPPFTRSILSVACTDNSYLCVLFYTRASLLSVNGFRIPRAGSGVLIGGDITKPEMRSVAKGFTELGFKLYCSSPIVEEFLNAVPYVTCKKIFFPVKDKRKLNEVFEEVSLHPMFPLSFYQVMKLTRPSSCVPSARDPDCDQLGQAAWN